VEQREVEYLGKWDAAFDEVSKQFVDLADPQVLDDVADEVLGLEHIETLTREYQVLDSQYVAIYCKAEPLLTNLVRMRDVEEADKSVNATSMLELLPSTNDRKMWVRNELREYEIRITRAKTLLDLLKAKKRFLYRQDERLANLGHNIRRVMGH
jgi:hypothetical protein